MREVETEDFRISNHILIVFILNVISRKKLGIGMSVFEQEREGFKVFV